MRGALALTVVALALAAGCVTTRESPGSAVVSPLGVTAGGSFRCGEGVHGCTAWSVVRPAPWTGPGWLPRAGDGQLRAEGDGRGGWVVSGSPAGGVTGLGAGTWVLALGWAEMSDLESFVLGTEDRPSTGVVASEIACSVEVSVVAGTQRVDVRADFGPPCSILARQQP